MDQPHMYWHCPCSTVTGAKVDTYPRSPPEVVKYIMLGRRGAIMFYNVHREAERYQPRENDRKMLVKERPMVELGHGWPKAVSRPSRSSKLGTLRHFCSLIIKYSFSALAVCQVCFFFQWTFTTTSPIVLTLFIGHKILLGNFSDLPLLLHRDSDLLCEGAGLHQYSSMCSMPSLPH